MSYAENVVLEKHDRKSLLMDTLQKEVVPRQQKRELQLVALEHSAWRLLNKAFASFLQYQRCRIRRKERAGSALLLWRHRLLLKCVQRLHLYLGEVERRTKSLKTYKRISLQKGLKRLQMYRKSADLSTQTVILWKRVMALRAINCLRQFTSIRQWEAKIQVRIQDFRRFFILRRGWKCMESFIRNKRWIAELARRSREFQLMITPVHSLLRVFLKLRQRHQCTLRNAGKQSLAKQHYFRSTFRKLRIAVQSASFESYAVRLRKLARIVFEQLRKARNRRLHKEVGERYRKKRLILRVCSQWRAVVTRKNTIASVTQVISRKKKFNLVHKLFQLWVNQWISRKDKEVTRQYALGYFRASLTARCIKTWRSFVVRKLASGRNYQMQLVRRTFKSIEVAVKRRKELTLISSYVANVRTSRVVGKVVEAWNSYSDRKRVKRTNIRISRTHRCRHLQIQVFTALLQAVHNDTNRILTLTPIRRTLTQHFGLRLWKQAHTHLLNLKLALQSWKTIQKKKIYRKYLSTWTNRMNEKIVRAKVTLKLVTEARKRLQHYKLEPCFQAWMETHHLHLIKEMRVRKGRECYKNRTLRSVVPQWFGVTRILKVKRNRVISAMKHYNRNLALFLFTILKDLLINIGIKRRVHQIALFFSHKTKTRLLFNILHSHMTRKRTKREQEERALTIRRNELLDTSVRHIVRIALFWREQRMALTEMSRERINSKVWNAVAKFAERWKRNTFLKTSRSAPGVVIQRKPEPFAVSITRVNPRPAPEWISSTPTNPKPRPAPRRLNPKIPTSVTVPAHNRLQEIEAELLEFKIEKDALVRLEKQAVGDWEMKRVRVLREKHAQNQMRIKALCAEVASLKKIEQVGL